MFNVYVEIGLLLIIVALIIGYKKRGEKIVRSQMELKNAESRYKIEREAGESWRQSLLKLQSLHARTHLTHYRTSVVPAIRTLRRALLNKTGVPADQALDLLNALVPTAHTDMYFNDVVRILGNLGGNRNLSYDPGPEESQISITLNRVFGNEGGIGLSLGWEDLNTPIAITVN